MALSKYNTSKIANAGRPVELLDIVTQRPIGVRFFVLGVDSKEYQRITRKHEADRLDKQKKNRGRVYYLTPEESEANALELLTGLTTGWEEDVCDSEGKVTHTRPDIELEEGQFIHFTPEAAKAIYEELGYKWIREQIDTEIGDRRDFLPPAKRS
jgi:hypothetical protein